MRRLGAGEAAVASRCRSLPHQVLQAKPEEAAAGSGNVCRMWLLRS
jgi:hypothetical protein